MSSLLWIRGRPGGRDNPRPHPPRAAGRLSVRAPEDKNCPNQEFFQHAIVQQSAHVRNLFKMTQKARQRKKESCCWLWYVLSYVQESLSHLLNSLSKSAVGCSQLLWVVSTLPLVEISFFPTKYALSEPTGSHFLEAWSLYKLFVFSCHIGALQVHTSCPLFQGQVIPTPTILVEVGMSETEGPSKILNLPHFNPKVSTLIGILREISTFIPFCDVLAQLWNTFTPLKKLPTSENRL